MYYKFSVGTLQYNPLHSASQKAAAEIVRWFILSSTSFSDLMFYLMLLFPKAKMYVVLINEGNTLSLTHFEILRLTVTATLGQ